MNLHISFVRYNHAIVMVKTRFSDTSALFSYRAGVLKRCEDLN